MRKLAIVSAALLVVAAGAAGAQEAGQTAPTLKAQPAPSASQAGKPESVLDRASYVIGFNLGQSLKTNNVTANADLLIQGFRDALAGKDAVLTPEEMQAAMTSLQQQVQQQQQEKSKAEGAKNQAAGDAFLATNKDRPGVKTTASGLQYEVLTEGTGPSPKATDQVTVNYKGTLIDGTVFDSSYDRGEPATFVLNQVIGGWTEGVQLMKVGSKYKFYIPAALAYGERGAGGVIGPNSVLVFEVELLSIGEAPAAPEVEPQINPSDGAEQKPAEKPPV